MPTWAHGALLVTLVVLGGLSLAVVVRLLIRVPHEVFRKLLHFVLLAIVTAWLYAFENWRVCVLGMAVFVLIAYPVLLALERLKGFSAFLTERKPGELRRSLCAMAGMFILLTSVCWGLLDARYLALAGIYAWGPGDAAAALIGKRFGKTRIGRAKKKTREGTAAMFVCSFVCVLGVLIYVGRWSPLLAFPAALVTGAVTAWVELEALDGFDTFYCPAAAMAVLLAFRALAR